MYLLNFPKSNFLQTPKLSSTIDLRYNTLVEVEVIQASGSVTWRLCENRRDATISSDQSHE